MKVRQGSRVQCKYSPVARPYKRPREAITIVDSSIVSGLSIVQEPRPLLLWATRWNAQSIKASTLESWLFIPHFSSFLKLYFSLGTGSIFFCFHYDRNQSFNVNPHSFLYIRARSRSPTNMLSKIWASSVLVLALCLQASAHAAVAPLLGVPGDATRSDVQRPDKSNPCGNVNIASDFDNSTALLPDATGSYKFNATCFNG